MAHYAKVVGDLVTDVIVAEATEVANLEGTWIQTSYNTHRNVHLLGGTPMRANFAGVGYTYNAEHDVFIPPKPHNGWVLNMSIWDWEPPTPMPDEGEWTWVWDDNEETWVESDLPLNYQDPEP